MQLSHTTIQQLHQDYIISLTTIYYKLLAQVHTGTSMHQLARGKANSSIQLLEAPPAVKRIEYFNDSKNTTEGACQGGFQETPTQQAKPIHQSTSQGYAQPLPLPKLHNIEIRTLIKAVDKIIFIKQSVKYTLIEQSSYYKS